VINAFYKDFLDQDGSSNLSHEDADLTALAIETPEQWAISWTTFQDVYEEAQPFLGRWAATMTDVPTAEAEFWPTFARYGVGYNLLVLQRIEICSLGCQNRRSGSKETSKTSPRSKQEQR